MSGSHIKAPGFAGGYLLISREIETLREEGKDKAGRARNFLRAKLGFRAEELILFNMRPRRKYKKRKKERKGTAAGAAKARTTAPRRS